MHHTRPSPVQHNSHRQFATSQISTSHSQTDSIPTHANASNQKYKPLAKYMPRGELKEYVPHNKDTASKFRVYIHSTAPEFRDQTIREVRSLLSAAAPRHKAAPIMTKGSQGILTDCTLRDIYILSHGLRTADDVMIQVTKPKRKVGSFNKLIQGLQSMPIHAFAPRIIPPRRPHQIGKLTPEQEEADRLARERAEEPLLHNNIRVIVNKSILHNQKAVKTFASETVRAMLTLKRGQQLKKRQVKYTDNPALFGKADFEVDDTLDLIQREKDRKRLEKEAERQQRKLQRRILRLEAGESLDKRNILRNKGNLHADDPRIRKMKQAWYGDDGHDDDDDDDLENRQHTSDEAALLDDGYSINYNDFVKSDGEVDQDRLRVALEDLLRRTQKRDGIASDAEDDIELSDQDQHHSDDDEATISTKQSGGKSSLITDDALRTISDHVKIMKTIQDDTEMTPGEKEALRERVGTHMVLQDEGDVEREEARRQALLRGDNVTLRRMQIEDEEMLYEQTHGIVDDDDDDDDDVDDHDENDATNTTKKIKYSIVDDKDITMQKLLNLGDISDYDLSDDVDVDLSFGAQYLKDRTNIPQYTEKDFPHLQRQHASQPSQGTSRVRVREREDVHQQPHISSDANIDATISKLIHDGPDAQKQVSTDQGQTPLQFKTTQTPVTHGKSYEEVDPDWTENEEGAVRRLTKTQKRIIRQREEAKRAAQEQQGGSTVEPEPMTPEKQLQDALKKIAGSKSSDAPLKASLLATAYANRGTTGTEASKRILATAKKSIPKIHKFLPPEYRGLSDKKLKRRARHDKYLAAQLVRAKAKVERLSLVLYEADARVRRSLKAARATDSMKLPSIMIPPRPHSDIPRGAMTVTLERNVLRVSISAIGHRDHALYKRGYRTHLIETSMRETLASGALSLAYDKMSPLHPTSPLAILETDEYVTPIRKALHHLAKDVRVGRDPGDDHSAYALEEQNFFLSNAVQLLGEEEAQRQMLLALVEERKNVLSNPHSVREAFEMEKERQDGQLGGTDEKKLIGKQGKQKNGKKTALTAEPTKLTAAEADRNLISTRMLDDVAKRIPAEELQQILQDGGHAMKQLPSGSATGGATSLPDALHTGDAAHRLVGKQSTTVSHSSTDKSTVSAQDLLSIRPIDILEAVSTLPAHQQAQAATSLAAGLPFDRIAPLPSPLVTPIQRIAVHSRDHTPLSEVLAHTLSTGIIDADPAIRIFDPFCGSGTLVIESVFRFLGLPLAPLNRAFAFEAWPIHNEYEYNAMMREWKIQYQNIVDDFITKFGLTKHQVLYNPDGTAAGDGLMNETLSNHFPLFIGSDLRDKSIRASIHNSQSAGVNYFTHFIQSDFERMIRTAAKKWEEHLLKQSIGLDPHQQHNANDNNDDKLLDLNNPDIFSSFSLSDQRFDDYATIRRRQQQQQRARQELPLTFPYLQGYTLFANIPWGVSDQKPRKNAININDKTGRTYHINTTQQESMEDLYIRLGGVLHDHGHMFRDVFILSAHQKFEKLTSIGAQRAARQQERDNQYNNNHDTADVRKREVMQRNSAVVYQLRRKGELDWENIATFYNNGVKTHLLKLKM